MMKQNVNPTDMKVFLNHVYEFKKGVRQMVLYTMNKKNQEFAVNRLKRQRIKFVIQTVDDERINLFFGKDECINAIRMIVTNLFFGKDECINAIRMIVTRPLNQLTAEEDFILGAMLGYDICGQCKRYCDRKMRKKCVMIN